MRAQQLHHQPAAQAFLSSADLEDYTPLRLTGRIMKEDSCWEECESEYEESLSGYDLAFLGDAECE